MTSIRIDDSSIPDLAGKVAVVTGGASGIGYATANILAQRGAKVYSLDVNPPRTTSTLPIEFIECDVTAWGALSSAFRRIGHIDMAFANAGISETENFLEDKFDDDGSLLEPNYRLLAVNFRAVLNVVKLSYRAMKGQETGGSIVITSSATAYAPEHVLPIYSAVKSALVGLVRSLRSTLPQANITINAVAPAATETPLIHHDFIAPIIEAGLPTSSAHFVGRALVYAATATETRKVEPYGKDEEQGPENKTAGRWNGRVIVTMGDRYTEVEEPIANLRVAWFGQENTRLTRLQQTVTDTRGA